MLSVTGVYFIFDSVMIVTVRNSYMELSIHVLRSINFYSNLCEYYNILGYSVLDSYDMYESDIAKFKSS